VRRKLARFHGLRTTFIATFERYGKLKASGHMKHYMLISNIRDQRGRYLAHHVWMPLGKHEYVFVSLEHGDTIRFSAVVNMYSKGTHRMRHEDYGLVRPVGVEKVVEREQEKEIAE